MPIYLSAGVYPKEVDLSQVVKLAGASIGAFVFGSDRGPLGPQFIANDKQFISVYGKPNPQTSLAHYSALSFLRAGGSGWFNRVVSATTSYPILAFDHTAAPILVARTAAVDPSAYVFGANEDFIVYPIGPGVYGHGLKISVASVDAGEKSFVLNVYDAANLNVPLETFNLSMQRQLDGNGRQMYLEDVVNNFSNYIRVKDNSALTLDLSAAVVTPVVFSGASDGTAVGDSEVVAGWDTFLDTDTYTVNILVNAGYATTAIHQKMNNVAVGRGDAFAILDVPSASQALAAALTYRSTTLNLNSSYSGLFTPDYLYYDEYNDRQLYVPISGAVAAVFVHNDTQNDPWFAPAGLNRGIINDALGLRVKYLQGDRDQLYDKQINMVRNIPGQGIVVWGQRTQQAKSSALQSINVRRLLLVLEKSMASALQYSLFEPNDPFTRQQITLMLTEFLTDVQSRRGLYDFKVVCDETNNTAAIIDRNELHVDVYLKPVRAAEFIQLQSVLTRSGASFEELIASGGNFG